MGRQLLLLLIVFAAGAAIALAVGAKNVGTALGVAQVCFAVALVYVLLRD
jgi:uncharacterized membrane protein